MFNTDMMLTSARKDVGNQCLLSFRFHNLMNSWMSQDSICACKFPLPWRTRLLTDPLLLLDMVQLNVAMNLESWKLRRE